MVQLKVPLGTGLQTSGCRGCGEVFTGLSAFDRHRNRGKCLAPGSVSLVQRPDGIWRLPGEYPGRA
jgi:hypothetical protein